MRLFPVCPQLTAFAVAALLICSLSGCGSVPQPFRGTSKVTTDNPLIDVPGATGVAVVPPAGIPPEEAAALADAVVRQLLAMEVPAERVTGKGGLGFTLSGRAKANTAGSYTVLWSLRSRRGADRGS